MKKILTVLIILNFINSHAQKTATKDTVSLAKKYDTDRGIGVEAAGFSDETFHFLLNREFSKLVTGQSTIGVGTYASVDVQKTEATFSPSVMFKNGNILNFTFKGGATDGVSAVFNNSKLNTNLSFELQYNTIGKKYNTIYFDSETLRNYEAASLKADADHTLESSQLECLSELNTFYVEIEKLKKEIKESKSEMETLKSANNETQNSVIKARITYLECQIAILESGIQQNSEKIEAYLKETNHENEETNKLYKQMALNNKRAKNLESLRAKLEITGVTLYWFSFSYKLRNDAFKLLNSAESFENQVKEKNYLSHEFKSQFTLYHHNSNQMHETVYLAGALTYQYKSNYQDLSKVKVTDTETVGTTGTSTRETSDSFVAYQGDYKTGVNQLNLDIDFYYLFFEKDRFGIHVFPNSQFIQNLKPNHNLGVGLVMPFKDKTKEASVVNAEVYYNFLNVFNSNDSELNLFERNEIGLRFTFPFNF